MGEPQGRGTSSPALGWLLGGCLLLLDGRSSRAEPAPLNRPAPTVSARMAGSNMYVMRVPTINTVQTGVLVMDGSPYRIVERETPSRCDIGMHINARHAPLEQLMSSACRAGARCLQFEGRAAPSGCGPDRIEIDVASDEHALRFGDTGYLSFRLRVDPAVVGLGARALISQAWQFASVGIGDRPPLGPAFYVTLMSDPRDDDKVLIQFLYRNEVSAANPPHLIYERAVVKGEWHSFRMALTPRHLGHADGPGSILIWVDRDEGSLEPADAANFKANDPTTYRVYWGYPPDPKTRLGGSFEVRVGIYRPEPLTFIRFWMDQVQFERERSALPGN